MAESHLERLASDLESEAVSWDDALQYFSATRQHALSALRGFQAQVEALDENFLIDLYQASQERSHSLRRATYDELVATGSIEFLPEAISREILSVHYDLSERIQKVLDDTTDYRSVLRRHMDYRVQEAIVEACGDTYFFNEFGYRTLRLPETCSVELPATLVSEEVRRLHGNELVQQHLRYQLSNLGSRVTALESTLAGTRNTLAAVRQATGVHP